MQTTLSPEGPDSRPGNYLIMYRLLEIIRYVAGSHNTHHLSLVHMFSEVDLWLECGCVKEQFQ